MYLAQSDTANLTVRYGATCVRKRRWKHPFVLSEPPRDPVTNRQVMRLVECPYAQVVCYHCVAKGSGTLAVNEMFWTWECLLCEEEFTDGHCVSDGHVRRLSYLQGQGHRGTSGRLPLPLW